MEPSSYLYSERDGRVRLYLGGLPMLAGLRLFPADTHVFKIAIYTDTDCETYRYADTGTISSLVEHIMTFPGHVGIVEFSCEIADYASFSAHDDCECHFDASNPDVIRDLVFATARDAVQSRLWAILQATPDCYTVVSPDGAYHT